MSDRRPTPSDDPSRLAEDALRAMRSGDPATARTLLSAAVAIDPDATSLHLNLAAACRALGDVPAALKAVDEALISDPRNFMALLMKASLLEKQGKTRLAGSAYTLALAQAPPLERLDPAARRAAEHAMIVAKEHQEALVASLRPHVEAAEGLSSAEVSRLRSFADRLSGRRRAYHSQPMQYAYPSLPEVEFYDRSYFPWLADVEAAFPRVRDEFLAALDAGDAAFTPYVDYPDGLPLDQWAELNRSPRWSAYHLFKDGEPVPQHAAACPMTMEALSRAPQPQVPGRSPAAMFSLLKPRTRIPPHTGVSNTRLVVHLPLVVPEGCAFRVGSETRSWREGEAFVFDDTLEHEAMNDSDRWRAVMIFDVWSPFLSEAEKAGVVALTAALDAFHGVGSDAPL